MQLGDLNGPSQPALFCDSMMLTFVQSQAAQSLQQGRAGTCSTLLESSVAGSAVLVWAGVDGSFCPACFLPWELPAHGGSTLQTDTRGVCRSLGHLGLPPCSHNHKDGLRCNVERPLTGEELLRSTGISIQLPRDRGPGWNMQLLCLPQASMLRACRPWRGTAPAGTHVCQEPF